MVTIIWKTYQFNTCLHFICAKVDISKRCLGHAEQGLSWPLCEPIDGATVDEWREHTAPATEGAAYGTHGQHNVEVISEKKEVDSYYLTSADLFLFWSGGWLLRYIW